MIKINKAFVTAITVLASLAAPGSASAALATGTGARAQFDDFVSTLGDTYESFDGFAAQTNLTTQIPGLTFRTTVDGTGYHTAGGSRGTAVNLEVNVICALNDPFATSCAGSNRLIGGVRQGGVTDGQSIYEIVFSDGQQRVGLTRSFFGTLALTSFYSGTELLGEHQNTANAEFVGFISDPTKPITRVVMDGLPSGSGSRVTYNVGYADDLYFGDTVQPVSTVPEPSTWLMLLSGLVLVGRRFAR